jgi:hypothetical protein
MRVDVSSDVISMVPGASLEAASNLTRTGAISGASISGTEIGMRNELMSRSTASYGWSYSRNARGDDQRIVTIDVMLLRPNLQTKIGKTFVATETNQALIYCEPLRCKEVAFYLRRAGAFYRRLEKDFWFTTRDLRKRSPEVPSTLRSLRLGLKATYGTEYLKKPGPMVAYQIACPR